MTSLATFPHFRLPFQQKCSSASTKSRLKDSLKYVDFSVALGIEEPEMQLLESLTTDPLCHPNLAEGCRERKRVFGSTPQSITPQI
jgi:hypothetical protein